jgi:hypothetical protein
MVCDIQKIEDPIELPNSSTSGGSGASASALTSAFLTYSDCKSLRFLITKYVFERIFIAIIGWKEIDTNNGSRRPR